MCLYAMTSPVGSVHEGRSRHMQGTVACAADQQHTQSLNQCNTAAPKPLPSAFAMQAKGIDLPWLTLPVCFHASSRQRCSRHCRNNSAARSAVAKSVALNTEKEPTDSQTRSSHKNQSASQNECIAAHCGLPAPS